jgi:hypothetical protein
MNSDLKLHIGLMAIVFLFLCSASVSAADNSSVAVSDHYITIDPIGNHTIGDVFFINGTTNLPVSEKLTIEIVDYFWVARSHIKNEPNNIPPGKYVGIPDVLIISDSSGTNRWSVNVTDAVKGLKTSTFLASILSNNSCNGLECHSSAFKSANSTSFTLFSIPPTIAINYSTNQTTFQESITDTRMAPLSSTTLRSAPIPWTLSLFAFFIVIIIFKNVMKENEGL